VIRHDPGRQFRFASLQSKTGQSVLAENNLPAQAFDSFLLYDKGKLYTRSTAALKVSSKLSGGWKLLAAFLIIPPFIRNAVYDFIARNRYRWFGKKEACWLPTQELQSLFLDQ
jgi:predicted DCC family thiol-disulfide oxidoreductase YuxK